MPGSKSLETTFRRMASVPSSTAERSLPQSIEEVIKEAKKLGTVVTGSEIVGLIPKEALLMAGRFYSEAETENGNEEFLIQRAVDFLGLNQLERFDPNKKIIEYMIYQ